MGEWGRETGGRHEEDAMEMGGDQREGSIAVGDPV